MSSSCLEIYNGDAIRGAPPRQEHNLGGWPAPKLPLYRAAAVSSDGEDFCIVAKAALSTRLPLSAEAVAQTLGVIDFLYIHDKATISEGAFSVAESPVRPPEALL